MAPSEGPRQEGSRLVWSTLGMFSWQGPQATETHVSRKERDLLQDTRVWEEPKRSWTWGWSQEGSGTQKCCPWKVFLPLRPAQRAAQATEQGDVITPKVKFTSPPCKRPPGLNKNFSFPILLSRNCRLHLLSMKSSFFHSEKQGNRQLQVLCVQSSVLERLLFCSKAPGRGLWVQLGLVPSQPWINLLRTQQLCGWQRFCRR